MRSLELHQLDIGQLAAAYRQQLFSPVQVCEQLLQRIDNPSLNCNAFAHVDAAAALEQAQVSALRWQQGEPLGPLDGIPVAIKDVLDVAGMPTRHGSPACADAAASAEDSLLARRLRERGVILLGKTRTWEFAWRSQLERDPAEVVSNPAAAGRSAGGSSSGSAAAVAAGLCPLAFGTDSGGSVRGPASYCGVFGIKPSQGFIPVYPPSPMGEIEHIGAFARAVPDLRIALDQVGGYHPDDPDSWPYAVPLGEPGFETSKLRIGFSDDLNYGNPDAELRELFAAAVARLQRAGFQLRALEVPFCGNFDLTDMLYTPDAALSLAAVPESRRDRVDPLVAGLADDARRMSVYQYAQAELARDDTRRMFNRLFEEVDCLLTLTQENAAHRLDEAEPMMKLTRPFDMTGQPAISIPSAVTAAGLPVGLQLVCRRGADALLLAAAEKLAAALAR